MSPYFNIDESSKNERVKNYLKAVQFRNPNWIPCRINFSPATWMKYREELKKLVLRHHNIFPDYIKRMTDYDAMPAYYRRGELTDRWGCLWKNLEAYNPPDPLTQADRGGPQINWEKADAGLISL